MARATLCHTLAMPLIVLNDFNVMLPFIVLIADGERIAG